MRECLPLIVMLRERLKYALTYREVKKIVLQRLVKVDGKMRLDSFYPAGFMDVVQIEKTNENFRLLWDTRGRFALHRITKDEAQYKLCRVNKLHLGDKGIMYARTHDGRTLRYPDPDVKPNDTIRIEIPSGKQLDFLKFEVGQLAMISGGNNIGRVGTIMSRDRHPGSNDMVHLKDEVGHTFCTILKNVVVIGKGNKPWISLPKGNGIKLSVIEQREIKIAKSSKHK